MEDACLLPYLQLLADGDLTEWREGLEKGINLSGGQKQGGRGAGRNGSGDGLSIVRGVASGEWSLARRLPAAMSDWKVGVCINAGAVTGDARAAADEGNSCSTIYGVLTRGAVDGASSSSLTVSTGASFIMEAVVIDTDFLASVLGALRREPVNNEEPVMIETQLMPTSARSSIARDSRPRGAGQDPSKTVILVTHALHFLSQCDYIYTLAAGHIAEAGTYPELIVRGDEFARLDREFGGSGTFSANAEPELPFGSGNPPNLEPEPEVQVRGVRFSVRGCSNPEPNFR
ncbi:hypothetical protein C8R44DRAFT_740559 [Mycena epipterygia]|nr:hypothetical protein C8R44DRAFT_740559 [Mycena epipterygia]